ncbi:PREDICTED: LOC18784240 [Prunus dulcis]|uniref:PREDICTED: LOC18784240 n=1 Tax=Prunus dulcis TaxID=3755 RepID=A0A5E4GFX5_PRUDU|nr:PREDICTED: LOC18784240 [Prunus dulcis]
MVSAFVHNRTSMNYRLLTPQSALVSQMETATCNFVNRTDLRKGSQSKSSSGLLIVPSPYPCSSSKPGCLASAVDNGYTVRIESAKSNVVQDPVSHVYSATES